MNAGKKGKKKKSKKHKEKLEEEKESIESKIEETEEEKISEEAEVPEEEVKSEAKVEEEKEELEPTEMDVKPKAEESESSEILEVDFETESKLIIAKLSVDDFLEWAQTKLQETSDKKNVIVLAQLLIDNLSRSIDEAAFETVTRTLNTLDNLIIIDYSITESVNIDDAYTYALRIIKEQQISSHHMEHMLSDMCSHIEEMEEPGLLLLDEKLINQKQALLATVFYALYRQDPEAFIRHIEKAPIVMSKLVGEVHTTKWLVTTYILINRENETVGGKILETIFSDAERLANLPHSEGFISYLKTLLNTNNPKRISRLLKTIIDQLNKNNRGYEALEYLKKSEQLKGLIEDGVRYKLIRKSFENIANASLEDIDEFGKIIIYLEGFYGSLVHEIKGNAKIKYIILDLGLHLVRAIELLMVKMTREASVKEETLENLYVKVRFLLNGIVRVFRSYADVKMAKQLRDRLKDLPKDKKRNRELWIQTATSIVDDKK